MVRAEQETGKRWQQFRRTPCCAAPEGHAADQKQHTPCNQFHEAAVRGRPGAELLIKNRTFDSDKVYRQCLVNSRRMLRDREYWGLFADKEDCILPLQ
jgi:hypothetical protein